MSYRPLARRNAGLWRTTFALALFFFVPRAALAILIIGPNDPNTGQPTGGQLTGVPTGSLANSGYQFEGVWAGNETGTAIAPNYFITARHLGGGPGDTFTYQGQNYTATAVYDDPNAADLRIVQVSGTFSSYAPIYTGSDEVGKNMVVYGRGGPDGPNSANGVPLNGWQWTGPSPTQTLSYGTNTVAAVGTLSDGSPGQYILFKFNQALGSSTGALSAGDSGGGVFIQENGVWKLAGINYAADGPYDTLPSTDPNAASQSFAASLYNARGLYAYGDSVPISDSHHPELIQSSSISTRLSTELAFIQSIIGVPEPASITLVTIGLLAAALTTRRRLRHPI